MDRLPHYKRILENNEKAYYLRCKHIEATFDEKSTDLNQLFKEHHKCEVIFQEGGGMDDAFVPAQSFLDLKRRICDVTLKKCTFCENRCHVDRTNKEVSSKRGACGLKSESYISSGFLHYGEEQPLVPSGTIFFSGCSFGCVFCQNWDIADFGKKGAPVQTEQAQTPPQIAKLAETLYDKGARNINWVGGDPTPNLHNIVAALQHLDKNVCILWNSNFYNTPETIRILREIMDLWLPDFKYGNNDCGRKYSLVKGYWDVLTTNFKMIYDWGSRDILIRHLVLPNHVECCTRPILKWVSENIPEVQVNIMGQYHPDFKVRRLGQYEEINRRITREEMDTAFAIAKEYGVHTL